MNDDPDYTEDFAEDLNDHANFLAYCEECDEASAEAYADDEEFYDDPGWDAND